MEVSGGREGGWHEVEQQDDSTCVKGENRVMAGVGEY
jgi:hypothetical protein